MSSKPCKFYQRGLCKRGQECRFTHSNEMKLFECKWCLFGQCKYGDSCIFKPIKTEQHVIKCDAEHSIKYDDECPHCEIGNCSYGRSPNCDDLYDCYRGHCLYCDHSPRF